MIGTGVSDTGMATPAGACLESSSVMTSIELEVRDGAGGLPATCGSGAGGGGGGVARCWSSFRMGGAGGGIWLSCEGRRPVIIAAASPVLVFRRWWPLGAWRPATPVVATSRGDASSGGADMDRAMGGRT